MKILTHVFRIVHAVMALFFACAALMLMTIAARLGWEAFAGTLDNTAAQSIIEVLGLLAVVALQISETICEEEVVRDADISAPTRVRRYLSRFFVVIVVALSIEGLVATFKGLHENPTQLPYAASIVAAVGVILAAWGLFVHLNRSAEELEPEQMKEAKKEDEKLD